MLVVSVGKDRARLHQVTRTFRRPQIGVFNHILTARNGHRNSYF
jgi:hypothetical protein